MVIEEDKRSVETFYDCVDLDLEENPIDKVRSTTERNNPYERMNNDGGCCCFLNLDINVVYLQA